MSFAIRAAATAVLSAFMAAVLLFRPGSEPAAVAAQPPVDADLALVPADAVGFVHVRAADLWKNDLFALARQTFEKAGPKALAALDAQFVPKLSTFERVTAFLLLDGERKEPLPYLVLRFSAPFTSADVVKAYLPNAQGTNVNGKTVWASQQADFELYFPDNQHIMVSAPGAITRYLRHPMPKTGALSAGLKLAASGRPIVGSLSFAALPQDDILRELRDLPPEALPLFKAEHLTASLDLGTTARIDVVAGYKTAADAQAAEKAVVALAAMARKELAKLKDELSQKVFEAKGPRPLEDLPEAVANVFGLGAINHVDELLANPGALIRRNGSELTASVTLPKELAVAAGGLTAVGVGALLPAVQKVREAATRMTSQNNLKQIALAIHNYESAFGHLPQDITDKNGNKLLSWRVAILPFIEQDNLYRQFKLDEPWNSPHNLKLSQVAIKTYTSPQANPPTPPGMTHYKAFVGPGTMFEPGKKIKFTDVTDGTSNTIMVIEAGDPVSWAKPDDIPFDPKKPLPRLALPGVDGFVNVAMADGSVRALNMKTLTEATLKAAITRAGGEVLGKDW